MTDQAGLQGFIAEMLGVRVRVLCTIGARNGVLLRLRGIYRLTRLPRLQGGLGGARRLGEQRGPGQQRHSGHHRVRR
jgi:hypothetical protein